MDSSQSEYSDKSDLENEESSSSEYESTKEDIELDASDLNDSQLESSPKKAQESINSSVTSEVSPQVSAASNIEGSSDDEKSTNASPQAESDDEISSDDDIVITKKKKVNRILDDDDDSASDDEEKQRKSLYYENPEGDMSIIIEDQPFSKATRRSIMGFVPKAEPVSDQENSSDDSDGDSDIIICETDEEEVVTLDSSGMITEKLSSTIRSPFKEMDTNIKVEPDKVKKVSQSLYNEKLAEIETLKKRLTTFVKLEASGNLPDDGKKLREAMDNVRLVIREKEAALMSVVVDKDESVKSLIAESFKSETDPSFDASAAKEVEDDFLVTEDVQPKYTGKIGMKNFEMQKALTEDKLQDIHKSLSDRPTEDVLAESPKHIKVQLMKHQLHAIAFMQWREKQSPKGGILADDMGLGKTLTVIALILKQLQEAEANESDEYESDEDENEVQKENEWIAQGHKALRDGGTLVVCPASLINQWGEEIKTKVKRGALDVNIFHGAKRIYKAKELARYDVVITTYQIILSEFKNNGCLFGVKWDRIVLDEGHVIRNYRSKQSEAVCTLFGKRRWVLTGTPIQNKEFDLYAAIKFLRCSPFDDLRYWRMWIETRNKSSSPRLQALLKSILLRRTKTQLQESGDIDKLPEKVYELYNVALNHEERTVYNRMMALSQQVFAQYLAQQQEKHSNYTYDQNRLQKLHQKFAKSVNVTREIKSHEILTLLLRLRQICCHPGLVKEAIEKSELEGELEQPAQLNESANNSDIDILSKLHNLKINSDDTDETTCSAIKLDNDVFNMNIPSSKVDKLMDVIRERLLESDDKAIIVSQWVSYLNIVKGMLEIENIGYCELNGTIPVKFRNDIVVDFNSPMSSKKVMLLSITAGGVGLNLVGANTIFIMDPHWNPQIEQQAQDRVYRFGQKKDVKIYKFICEDTIEEKILRKQQEKLDLATSTLTGAKRSATKLTIEDLKDLFGMK